MQNPEIENPLGTANLGKIFLKNLEIIEKQRLPQAKIDRIIKEYEIFGQIVPDSEIITKILLIHAWEENYFIDSVLGETAELN